MVNAGIPDEVGVQQVCTYIVSGASVFAKLGYAPGQRPEESAWVPLLPVVTVEQVSHPFRNLKPNLHAQGALRKRTDQGFDRLSCCGYALHRSRSRRQAH